MDISGKPSMRFVSRLSSSWRIVPLLHRHGMTEGILSTREAHEVSLRQLIKPGDSEREARLSVTQSRARRMFPGIASLLGVAPAVAPRKTLPNRR